MKPLIYMYDGRWRAQYRDYGWSIYQKACAWCEAMNAKRS